MGRTPRPSSHGESSSLKKGPWSPEEDEKLVQHIQKHGHSCWNKLPKLAGLNRCGKSCRLRWTNYLNPEIKSGDFSQEEENIILNLHSMLGNKWSTIASHLPGRTDNNIKNFWNTRLKKKLIQMGLDPMTHQPLMDPYSSLMIEHESAIQLMQLLNECLTQPSNSLNYTSNNYSYDQNNGISITNMEAYSSLLNPIVNQNPVINLPQIMDNNNNNNADHQNLLSHDHFVDPQVVPLSSQPYLNTDGNNSMMINQGIDTYAGSSSWIIPSSSQLM